MALSNEFLDYLAELSKIKNWEKFPNNDPRIMKLQELAKASSKDTQLDRKQKRVAIFKEGKFVRIFNSAAEAAEALGVRAAYVRMAARGDKITCAGYMVEYIRSEDN
jgi:hypothetical protein